LTILSPGDLLEVSSHLQPAERACACGESVRSMPRRWSTATSKRRWSRSSRGYSTTWSTV